MTLDDVKTMLNNLHTTVRSASRLTRDERVRILRQVYSIRLNVHDTAELMKYIVEQRKIEGANRSYVEKGSNRFVLPLRYIFPTKKDRTNVSRYSGALSRLESMRCDPDDFAKVVKSSGGLQELYWQSRNASGRVQNRNKLTLDTNVKYESGVELVLRLMPMANGVFKVLEEKQIR